MSIDLKWGLPFAVPTVVMAFILAFCWVFGVPVSPEGRGAIAFFVLSGGTALGALWAAHLHEQGERWTVQIGPRPVAAPQGLRPDTGSDPRKGPQGPRPDTGSRS